MLELELLDDVAFLEVVPPPLACPPSPAAVSVEFRLALLGFLSVFDDDLPDDDPDDDDAAGDADDDDVVFSPPVLLFFLKLPKPDDKSIEDDGDGDGDDDDDDEKPRTRQSAARDKDEVLPCAFDLSTVDATE